MSHITSGVEEASTNGEVKIGEIDNHPTTTCTFQDEPVLASSQIGGEGNSRHIEEKAVAKSLTDKLDPPNSFVPEDDESEGERKDTSVASINRPFTEDDVTQSSLEYRISEEATESEQKVEVIPNGSFEIQDQNSALNGNGDDSRASSTDIVLSTNVSLDGDADSEEGTSTSSTTSGEYCAVPRVPLFNASPRRSLLKRRSEAGEEASTPKKKRSIAFEGVTVFYFPRAQGFTCVPSQVSLC